MIFSKNKKSLTLVQLIVATVILSASVTGLFAAFVSGKKITARSRRKLIAINYARQIAESLKSAVRQDEYDDPAKPLGCAGAHPFNCPKVSPIAAPAGLTSFGATNGYTVTDIPVGSAYMRKVTITVNWNEPST